MTLAVTAAIAAFVCSAAAVRTLRSFANRRALLDRPNERSAHANPTPRIGGAGLMAVFLPLAAAVAYAGGGGAALVVVGATAVIAAMGLVDDVRPLRARTRLVVQLAAATLVVTTSWPVGVQAWSWLPPWSLLVIPASVLWIVWVTNLYNFMDGIDGLAGGQAVIGGVAVAAAAWSNGAPVAAHLAILLAAAAGGFLLHNFPRASIFMGDAGSTAIGFFLAALPFASGAALPVEVVALALSLFVLDASWTLVRRVAAGQRFYEAHRTHWYQRPLTAGVSHVRITLVAYCGMVVVGVVAVAYARAHHGAAALAVVSLAVFAALAGVVLLVERRARLARSHAAEARSPIGDSIPGSGEREMEQNVAPRTPARRASSR
jgi:Fuc2NAc and GlcNAc transferase